MYSLSSDDSSSLSKSSSNRGFPKGLLPPSDPEGPDPDPEDPSALDPAADPDGPSPDPDGSKSASLLAEGPKAPEGSPDPEGSCENFQE